jgi:hypothetical protein
MRVDETKSATEFPLLAEQRNQLSQNPMLKKVTSVPFVRRHWHPTSSRAA